jgi:peptidoglycan/xylan/chitin deacetylase (PgdA/CDA1 family)
MTVGPRGAALTAAAVAGLSAAPSPVSLGPVRKALTPALLGPRLSGMSGENRVALTFDDGPDPASTPAFLRLLDELGVSATFFVLGRHIGSASLLREMAAAGHDIGVHGWDHRPVALHGPRGLRDGLLRTRDLVEDATGRPVRFYRPPYGVVTGSSVWAARSTRLATVLWSAWGRDWQRRATPGSVTRLVSQQLSPGGTVLLHDSDRTSAPGSWRTTLVATERLVHMWLAAGLCVGGLDGHWPEPASMAA